MKKTNLFARVLSSFLAIVILLPFAGCKAESKDTESQTDPAPVTSEIPEESSAPEQTEPSVPVDDGYEHGDVPRIYIYTDVEIPNYAYGIEVQVTGDDGTGEYDQPRTNATDSNDNTSWISQPVEEQTFVFDLGEPIKAGYIQLQWGVEAAVKYEIAISKGGENWTALSEVTNGFRNKRDHLEFASSEFRYVKIHVSESNHGKGYEIVDLFVMKERMPTTGHSKITTGDYVPAKVAVVDKVGGTNKTVEAPITIRIRGNSTAGTDKVPYNIKFEEKQDLLGIKGSRKWCLLANHFDKTLIRNKIAYDFCRTAGVPCFLESTMVEVFIDGKYKGLYQLTEPVTDAKTSVDIDVENGEYIIERNGYYNFDPKWNHSPVYGIRFVGQKPDPEELTREQKDEIGNYLTLADAAARTKNLARIETIFDVDSFVSFYICEELMKDIDIYHGSSYFYIKNGKIYAGPMWDMDLSMGNVSKDVGLSDPNEEKYRIYWNVPNFKGKSFGDGSGDSTQYPWALVDWYAPLMECEAFHQKVVDKFTELQPAIRALYADGGAIDQLVESCHAAALRDYTDYGTRLDVKYFWCECDEVFETYEDAVQYLKDWLRARHEWMCGYLGVEFSAE